MSVRPRQSFYNLLRDMYTEDRFQRPERVPRVKRIMDWAILILALASVLLFAIYPPAATHILFLWKVR